MIFLKHCLLCGGFDFKILNKKGIIKKGGEPFQFNNNVCRNCGLVFINPQPSKEGYAEIYNKYEAHRHDIKNVDDANMLFNYKYKKNIKGAEIYEFIKEYLIDNRAVLDIGCASGQISDYLKNNGNCDVQAVEPSKMLSGSVRKILGLNVYNGTFDNFYNINNKKFNILIMHHVFEHFVDPEEKLMQFKNLLLPGGVIYIEVPDVTNFSKPVDIFFDYMHPFSYSPKTIKNLIYKNGYKIIKVNQNKLYRIQIIIAPNESSYADIGNDCFWTRGGYAKTVWFIKKRRIFDKIMNFYRSYDGLIKFKRIISKKRFS